MLTTVASSPSSEDPPVAIIASVVSVGAGKWVR